MAEVVVLYLDDLNHVAPATGGKDAQARKSLTAVRRKLDRAEEAVMAGAHSDASRTKRAEVREAASRELGPIASALEKAGDPMASEAWLEHASTLRYAPGNRDATLRSMIRACYLAPLDETPWKVLMKYVAGTRNDPPLDAWLAIARAMPPVTREKFEGKFRNRIPRGTKAMPVPVTPTLTEYAVGLAELYEGETRAKIEKQYRAAVRTNEPK